MALKNYYAILGVSPNETPAGIRAAYRNAVQRTHPDHAGPQAAPAFQEIVEAHSVLSDPDRRRQYNEDLNLHQLDQSRTRPVHRPAAGNEPRSIFVQGMHRAQRTETMSVEVILTREEAALGGVLSIDIPVRERCELCGGTGSDWLFPCLHCRGEGTVFRMRPVQVPIPQSISLGMTREVTLETRGIKLLIRVSNEQFY